MVKQTAKFSFMEQRKETPWGMVPQTWKISIVKDEALLVTDYVANGSFASLAENVEYKSEEDYAVLVRLVDYNNDFQGPFVFIDENAYEFLAKSKLYGDEIIISNVGANVGTVFKCPRLKWKMSLAPNAIMVKFKGNNDFYYYWLKSKYGQHMLSSIVTGSAQPKFNKTNFRDLTIPVPPINEQKQIAKVLASLDDKIELNRRINDNLEQQAQSLFKSWFVDNASYSGASISDYFLPSRGKNLLTSDAKGGKVPVVAGGLTPSAYHDVTNTKAPVITISASGANAGYVNLWGNPVWSSDSSYIDDTITSNIYFWYNLLKYNQRNIYESQTGSAQPHIYPKHIGNLLIPDLDMGKVECYDSIVASMYLQINEIQQENQRLSALRDALLPKLMSGELKISSLNN